jgi:type II secretory pathway pseudopilin PulG
MKVLGFQYPSLPAAGAAGRRLSGYTLVEVIVCLGVIAVLCGVLLPSLRATREQANRLACASNMHQIGVALGAWGLTHDQEVPHSRKATATGFPTAACSTTPRPTSAHSCSRDLRRPQAAARPGMASADLPTRTSTRASASTARAITA